MKINCISPNHFDPIIFPKSIGLIALSTDLVSEQDFAKMNQSLGYAIYSNRIEFCNPITDQSLLKMADDLSEAARLITPDITLDSIVFSCTSGSVRIGNEKIAKLINKHRQHESYISTPTLAAVKAMRALDVKKIAILAPYNQSVSLSVADFFNSLGFVVSNLCYLNLETDQQISQLNPDEITKLALSTVGDAEAIFLSCTGLRALSSIQAIESKTNAIAISSNQAMFWDAIAAKSPTNIPYGKLFQTPYF